MQTGCVWGGWGGLAKRACKRLAAAVLPEPATEAAFIGGTIFGLALAWPALDLLCAVPAFANFSLGGALACSVYVFFVQYGRANGARSGVYCWFSFFIAMPPALTWLGRLRRQRMRQRRDHQHAHLWTQDRHVHLLTQAARDRDICDC